MRPAAPRADSAEGWAGVRQGLLIGTAVLVLTLPPVQRAAPPAVATPAPLAATAATPLPASGARLTAAARPAPDAGPGADFRGRSASPATHRVADWVARSGDNGRRPFVILDKRDARVYVFDRSGALVDASPVLLGFAPGDDSADGIGDRALDQVAAHEKTTPAGRFEAERGHDTTGEDVVWIDYDAAVAMHRVRAVDPKERRLARLASPDPADRRISFGCINVPVAFFENVVAPAFSQAHAIVYVLPETKPLTAVFGPGVG